MSQEDSPFFNQKSFWIGAVVILIIAYYWLTKPSDEENRQQAKLEAQVRQDQSERASQAAKESARQHELLTSYKKTWPS